MALILPDRTRFKHSPLPWFLVLAYPPIARTAGGSLSFVIPESMTVPE